MRLFTGNHSRTASRSRLERVRGYTALPGAGVAGAVENDAAGMRLGTGDPFAMLLKLPKQRSVPSTFALGILSALTSPSVDSRVGTAGGVIVKGRLMKLECPTYLARRSNGRLTSWTPVRTCAASSWWSS